MHSASQADQQRIKFIDRMWDKHKRRVEQIPKSMVHCLDELDFDHKSLRHA